jgi:hypothetical protein
VNAMQILQERLQGTNALIARHQQALSNPRISEAEAMVLSVNLKSLKNLLARLESQFLELAAAAEKEVYRYRLLTGNSTPSLAGVGEAWSKLQNLFGSIYKSLAAPPQQAKKSSTPGVISPEMGYAYSFPGSVGVVVTLPRRSPETTLVMESPVEDASNVLFDLIESRDFQRLARSLGPGPLQAMDEWLEVHVRNQYGVALEWTAENETKRRSAIQFDELVSLQNSVRDVKARETITTTGLLSMLDTDNKSFRLHTDSGQDFSGKFVEGIAKEDHAVSLPARYKATLLTVTEIIPSDGKKPKSEVFLEKLEPL